ncbi:MAG: ribonuclease D [Solirubrobacterales bacterium]
MAAFPSAPVSDPSTVDELAAAARASGRIGVDTEFMGEGRYQSELCLTQVSVEEGGELRIELIDPQSDIDPTPLAEVLADPAVEVVFHAGRQDVAILRRTWQTDVTTVFDTQVGAAFLGLGPQLGYSPLVGRVLGKELKSSAAFTRWDTRPLTEEQLRYAAEDVLDLLEVAGELQRRLREHGRLEWAREECRAVAASSDERDPAETWRRLPKSNRLSPRQSAVARELAAWRDRTARSENRPPASVVADAPLAEIAKRRPAAIGDLKSIRGLHPPVIKRRGEAMLAAVRDGNEAEPIERESTPRTDPDPADAPVIALAESLIRQRVLEANLAYELVAARKELNVLVAARRKGREDPDVRVLSGWRRELVGDELLELLAGRLAVTREPGAGVRVAPVG